MHIPFVPAIPKKFSYIGDAEVQSFLREICTQKTLDSFCRKIKAKRRYTSSLNSLVDRHYLELLIVGSFGRKEAAGLFDEPPPSLLNGYYEAGEFITVASAVYRQLSPELKRKFSRRFNGMFENSQGLIPLAHEFITAYGLNQQGFEVEFTEFAGRETFDFQISKQGVAAQVDCKSISTDNGCFFDLKTGDMAYEIIGGVVARNAATFANNILHLKVTSRDRRQYDVGSEIKKLLRKMILENRKVATDVMELELLPFTDTLFAELRSVMPSSNISNNAIDAQIASIIARVKPDLHKTQVEAAFIPPLRYLKELRFGVLMTSYRSGDWKANAVSAIKASLDGQLREQPVPVIIIRFNGLNTREDTILWDVARSSANYRSRLCAIVFTDQPTYKKSSILGPRGTPLYMREPNDRYVYLPDNPYSFQLKSVIDHIEDRHPVS